MIPINAVFDDIGITEIITNHINDKTAALINWYTALKEPSSFLPDGFSESEAEEVICLLQDAVRCREIVEMDDQRLQFALSCILEEEEKVTEAGKELSAEFSEDERRELEKHLPEEEIRYYENYDHFRDLIIPYTDYLNIAMKNRI